MSSYREMSVTSPDPSVDWSRYSCPRCGQLLTILAVVERDGQRIEVPYPGYDVPRKDHDGRSLLQANLAIHRKRHEQGPWKPRRGRPAEGMERLPIPYTIYLHQTANGNYQTMMAMGKETSYVPPDARILKTGRIKDSHEGFDLLLWETFVNPRRKRLQTCERVRHFRARRRSSKMN